MTGCSHQNCWDKRHLKDLHWIRNMKCNRAEFQDENKCTFIIVDKNKWLQPEMTEIECMAGDVNLFVDDSQRDVAEIEIMIAEPSCRRCGLGREALLTMMNYGITSLGVQKYVAKIGCGNEPSLTLFHKLGFY
ncbi:N-acetyltransferase 9 [Desmophyllum pertusum]|uniref:N-acetyltransferase 9 n=1 Tax=Desmophyllum pertusum TaxID=174260 RepID=A0A9W9Z7L1_9CNID|nr:N-acetyltransferase 9 [Desmophyllum pertusum]